MNNLKEISKISSISATYKKERKRPKSGSKTISSVEKGSCKHHQVHKAKEEIVKTPKILVERDAYRFKVKDVEQKIDSILKTNNKDDLNKVVNLSAKRQEKSEKKQLKSNFITTENNPKINPTWSSLGFKSINDFNLTDTKEN